LVSSTTPSSPGTACSHQQEHRRPSRQCVHRRRNRRSRPDPVRCQQRARLYLSRSVRRAERRGARHRATDSDRGQSRRTTSRSTPGRRSTLFSYHLIDATYQFTGAIASPNNPSADADGNIFITPGKTIPGIPRHQFKTRIDYAMTPDWIVGGDIVAVSSQYYIGDDANQNDKLPAYWVANLHTSYQATKALQVFGLVTNLFNKRYSTFGTYFEPGQIVNALANPPTDPRMQTPAQPLSVYVGPRLRI
jgi:hypothetical protein